MWWSVVNATPHEQKGELYFHFTDCGSTQQLDPLLKCVPISAPALTADEMYLLCLY
jgi:hypothetical protein